MPILSFQCVVQGFTSIKYVADLVPNRSHSTIRNPIGSHVNVSPYNYFLKSSPQVPLCRLSTTMFTTKHIKNSAQVMRLFKKLNPPIGDTPLVCCSPAGCGCNIRPSAPTNSRCSDAGRFHTITSIFGIGINNHI